MTTRKITVPSGYCSTCVKQGLDTIDLHLEAEESLDRLRRKLLVAMMIGDRDGVISEICYQLGITEGELSVAGIWESPKLTREMAIHIAEEIYHKFPEILEHLIERHGIMEKMRRRDEMRRREDAMWSMRLNSMMQNKMDAGFAKPTLDEIFPPKKDYYVPPYRVKKNER